MHMCTYTYMYRFYSKAHEGTLIDFVRPRGNPHTTMPHPTH
jgi:hypothetical protein